MSERLLDGNAIGGLLLELFGIELTAAPCVCGGCGAREEVARLDVYVDCPGVVIRCRHCGDVMITIVCGRERTWVDLRGTRGLEL
jgi:hypothetical protein